MPDLGEQAALPEAALPAPSAIRIRRAAVSGDAGLVKRAIVATTQGRALAQSAPFVFAGHHIALWTVAGQHSASVADTGSTSARATAPCTGGDTEKCGRSSATLPGSTRDLPKGCD